MSRLTRLGATTVLSGLLVVASALPGAAQSFDDGSFGDSGGGGFPAPGGGGSAPPSGSGDFAEGSFGDSGSGGSGAGGFPGPSGTPPSGFDEGSFTDGGGGGSVPPPDGDGGGSFPGGGGAVTPPGGGDFNPPDQGGGGGGIRPPDGGGVRPPDGGGVRPPDGGGVRPPDGGGNVGIAAQIIGFETRDFGVPPQQNLRNGQFHAPTPTAIPGANLVTTQDLASAMQSGMQMVLIEVLGGTYGLPNSFTAPALASPGSFNDRVQQQANQWLFQITGGNTSVPVVVYCSDPMCWMSYNAALRVRAAGFDNVYWYRGGLKAWEMAGLPLQPLGF